MITNGSNIWSKFLLFYTLTNSLSQPHNFLKINEVFPLDFMLMK